MLSVEDLEELLNMAVSEEKYELAVNLRDTIKEKRRLEKTSCFSCQIQKKIVP